MSWIRYFFLFSLLVLVACSSSKEENHASPTASRYLVEAETASQLIERDSVKVLDLRKFEAFSAGHIPGAINIWRTELKNDSFPYDGILLNSQKLEELFSAKGIKSDDFLILYDDHASCEAARMWWVLQYYRFDRVAILDGGINAWKKVGGLSQKVHPYAASQFSLAGVTNEKGIARLENLRNTFDTESVVMLDVRTAEEYSGRTKKNGALKNGRISGSVHLDWVEFVDQSTGKFKQAAELEKTFEQLGVSKENTFIPYCHSGVRSAHTYFVLTELLHLEHVQNYDGSWVEWSYYPLPAERDTILLN